VEGNASCGGTPSRARNRLTEKASRELEHFGARDQKEDER